MKDIFLGKFETLAERDKRAVILCSIFLSLALAWFLALKPSYEYYAESRAKLTENVELAQWVEQNSQRFEAISEASEPQKLAEDIDPLQLLSKLAGHHSIEIDRIEPTTDERVRSTYTRVTFKALLNYIAAIETEGLFVDSLSIDTTGTAGFINASLVVAVP